MPRRTRPPRTPCTAPPDPPAYSVRRTADIRAARSCRISRRRIGRGLACPRRTPRRISSRRQTLQARLAVQARSHQSRRGRAIGHGAGRSTRLLSSAQADSPPGRLHAYIHSQFSARPSAICFKSRYTAVKISSGSKPLITAGIWQSRGRNSKPRSPIIVATWPGQRKP